MLGMWALAAVTICACSGPMRTTQAGKDDHTADSVAPSDPIRVDVPTAPSPLSIHGDTLVQRVGHELRWWDVRTMKFIDTMIFDDLTASAFLADGTLGALVESADSCSLHRLSLGKPALTHRISPCSVLSRLPPLLLDAATADEVYIVTDEDLELFRFAGFDLQRKRTVALPSPRDPRRGRAIGLGDGRVLVPTTTLAILGIDAPARTLALGDRQPVHLSRATAGRFWYSHGTRRSWGASRITLATVDAPATDVFSVDLAPARIVEVAANGSALAILAVTREGAWTISIVEESGNQRAHVTIEPERARVLEPERVALALGPNRVVVGAPDGSLFAWDAITGAPAPTP